MPGKRRDQRLLVEDGIEKLVVSTAGLGSDLAEAAKTLQALVETANQQLAQADLTEFESLAARQSGRRGACRFEIDPDGKLVLVVSYGGEESPALLRDTFKAKAWNKRADTPTKKAPKPAPPKKKRGFMKTSPSVSNVRVVDPGMFEDDLSRLFAEPEAVAEPAPEPTPTTPLKRRRMTRLSGSNDSLGAKKANPLQAAAAMTVSLDSILSSADTKDED